MPARDPDAFVREVTRRIAFARKAAGLTQEAAAQRYGTALKNWQRFEGGQNITLHTLARIALTLGTSPDDLVAGAKAGQAVSRSTPALKKKLSKPVLKLAANPSSKRAGPR